uniref:Uncharacterized protein n=1 Tax=Rhipicephalus zambeziensis TaxID=60191 RepID=A0A224YVQ5_9ACAR
MPNQGFASPGRGGYQPRGGQRTRGSAGFRSTSGPALPRVGSVTGGFRSAGFRNSFRPRAPSVTPRALPQDRGMAPPMHTSRLSDAASRRPSVSAASNHAPDMDERGSSSRKPVTHSVSVWTVQIGEAPISYFSRERWRDQCRPEKGMRPDAIDEPFRGCTLQDRHPNEPKATYSEQELRNLCHICGTLVIHWETHKQGKLHRERVKARESYAPSSSHGAGPTQQDVVAALRVLQATRPDIIAASFAASTPNLLMSLKGAEANRMSPPRLADRMKRSGRSPSPDRKRHASRWEPAPRDVRYDDAPHAVPRGPAPRAIPPPMQPMYNDLPPGPGRSYASGSYTWR